MKSNRVNGIIGIGIVGILAMAMIAMPGTSSELGERYGMNASGNPESWKAGMTVALTDYLINCTLNKSEVIQVQTEYLNCVHFNCTI